MRTSSGRCASGCPDPPHPQPPRHQRGHVRIPLDPDPRPPEARRHERHRSRPDEGIEHRAAPGAHRQHLPDHRLRGRVPAAVRVRARQRQHPGQRGGARPDRMRPRLAEAEHVVDAVVPALTGADLRPTPLGLERPAGPAHPAREQAVDAHPLPAVVAVAQHEPAIAVGRQHPPPLSAELHGEATSVAVGGGEPASPHEIGRRGHDDPDLAGADTLQVARVAPQQPAPAVTALVDGHSGYGTNSSATSTSPLKRARASAASRSGAS